MEIEIIKYFEFLKSQIIPGSSEERSAYISAVGNILAATIIADAIKSLKKGEHS